MNIEQIIFYVLSGFALCSAILVVTLTNFVRSIFLFFLTLFCMAGLFVFALADFVAITQLVIYVGGVLVLMIFAFLLSNKELLNNPDSKSKTGIIHYLPGAILSLIFLGMLIVMFSDVDFAQLQWIKSAGNNTLKPTDNTIHYLGINIMTRYLLPFEVVSVLLLMALIGAAHLARKERDT